MESPEFFQKKRAVALDRLQLEAVPFEHRDAVLQMLNDPNFIEAESLQSQFRASYQYLRGNEKRMSYEKIGELFHISRQSAHKFMKRAKTDEKPIGRPPILSPEILDFIIASVNENYGPRSPISYFGLLDLIQFNFGICIKADTLRYICRALPDIHSWSANGQQARPCRSSTHQGLVR